MATWKDDAELFALIRQELFTALVGDILDQNGYEHQFLPPEIRPLDPRMVVTGRAMPVLEADIDNEIIHRNPQLQKPFGLMFEALDSLKPNEVYICSGASPAYALWGGLMSVRAIHTGAAGAVVNGYSRDTNEILGLSFPTFSMGGYAQDQAPRGKVVDFGNPIRFGKVIIKPYDIIFGDRDGIVVIPAEVENDVLEGALEKARGEHLVRKSLEKGMTTVEAFARYGIM
ncbi:MAG: RraA family protein [Cyclobacteriaceae bacterium]